MKLKFKNGSEWDMSIPEDLIIEIDSKEKVTVINKQDESVEIKPEQKLLRD